MSTFDRLFSKRQNSEPLLDKIVDLQNELDDSKKTIRRLEKKLRKQKQKEKEKETFNVFQDFRKTPVVKYYDPNHVQMYPGKQYEMVYKN